MLLVNVRFEDDMDFPFGICIGDREDLVIVNVGFEDDMDLPCGSCMQEGSRLLDQILKPGDVVIPGCHTKAPHRSNSSRQEGHRQEGHP